MTTKNLFGKERKSRSAKSNVETLMAIMPNYANEVALSKESRNLLGKAFLSRESFTTAETSDLDSAVSGYNSAANGIANQFHQETGTQLTEDQIEGLKESMAIAQNPAEYMKAATVHEPGTIMSSIGSDADVGVVDMGELSKESFEVHNMVNTLAMTASYNIRPERQSKAVELFFPTTTLDSTVNNITINVSLSTVFNSKEYEVTGQGDVYRNQKHIIKSLRDANILKSNFTDIVPVYRQGVNESFFVDSNLLAPHIVKTDYDEDITTSLLKCGKEIKLIHISQTDRMIANGQQDDTDQIAANPKLKTLGLKVGNDVVLFQNLQYHQASQFTYAPTGDREGILLNYDVNTHLLDEFTIGENSKGLPPELQVLKDKGLEVLLRFNINGMGNTNFGHFTLNPAQVSVSMVRDAKTKKALSFEDPAVQALVAEIEKTSIIGYELDANRTNSNIREHGLLLDEMTQRIIYGVKLHAPIAIRCPIDDKDTVSDSQRIDSLIKTSFIRRTNAGITALYDILQMLSQQPKDLDFTQPYANSIIGAGQYYVNTYVRDLRFDVLEATQSLQTVDVTKNISGAVTNFILAEMAQAYAKSELAAAYELTDIGGGKPHVIAIADVYTSKFIFREGDARTLGDGFKFTIEECSDGRLVDGALLHEKYAGKKMDGEVGTIFLSFGKPTEGSMSVPLFFGETLDKREVPRIVTRSRGSKHQHEVMVQPWFTHICHLPILIRIVVTNMKRAIQECIPFKTKEVGAQATNP